MIQEAGCFHALCVFEYGVHIKTMLPRNVPVGGVRAFRPPILSNVLESWSKGSHAARELAAIFSVTLVF